jgi:guanine deaminase
MILQGRLLIDPASPPMPGWMRLDGDRIESVREGDPLASVSVDVGGPDHLICPGFIDAHTHLPQFGAIGCDGMELMEWLERVIYPAEARWQDAAVASSQIDVAHARMLRAGTLGYAGYLTSHAHGIGVLAEVLRRERLRAVAGQMLMDRGGPPSLINQSPQPLRAYEGARLTPSANPRFAPACSSELLTLAGELAGDVFPIQTHLAESRGECAVVRQLHPDSPHYAGVYEKFGLLTPRTLLAHCAHLSAAEWALIRERGSAVVHCPGANVFLRSGLFDLDAAREHGVRLALGSDVAAGPDVAMPRVARAMIEMAKMRAMTITPGAWIPAPADAWRMITRGNADALGWSDAGRLEAGAAADLLALRVPFEVDEHLIGRLIHGWEDGFIAARIVDGRGHELPPSAAER